MRSSVGGQAVSVSEDKPKNFHVKDLLSLSLYPDPDLLEKAVKQYQLDSSLKLFGLISEEEIVGLIGYRYTTNKVIEIIHLSVRPDCRGAGFGRGLILELISNENPKEIIVETDEEVIDFYRRIGFEISSLGEKYPGVERFQCSYLVF